MIDQLKENELLQDKVNRELELKVQERTGDLLEAQEEIKRINELLHADNKKLESNVKTLHKARVMQKAVSFEEFQTIYPDDKACYEYLSNLKWGKGFKCTQCQNIKFTAGNTPYSRRCTRCGFIESVTANTIFYRLKFPIIKAFYLVFLVSTRRNITSEELSQTVTLRKQTCWTFRKKILEEIAVRTKKKNQNINWNQLVLASGNTQVDSVISEESDTLGV